MARFDVDPKLFAKAVKCMNDVFKYPDFKCDLQKVTISRILIRKYDVMVSLPDGYGRALCYQLPAAMLAGTQATVIIYSQESRTKEDVKRLRDLGVPCEMIDANTSDSDHSKILDDMRIGAMRPCLLYVSVDVVYMEKVESIISFLRKKKRLAYVVVNEVHSKQSWQDVKSMHTYKKIGTIRTTLTPEIPWIVVGSKMYSYSVDYLERILHLKTNQCGYGRFFAPAFRSNIYYECVIDDFLATSVHNLIEFIDQHLATGSKSFEEQLSTNNGSGLIFCKNQEKCVEIASELCKRSIPTASYHGGLNDNEKKFTINLFMKGYYKILAVTSYTGGNIKKPDLRFVVHWGLPTNIMCYYNHTQLAGKDGKFARCRIYATEKSLDYYKIFRESELLKKAEEGDFNDKLKYSLYLNAHIMKEYCTALQCRQSIFATYFGDPIPKCIDKCDTCVAINKGSSVLRKKNKSSGEPVKNESKMKALKKMMEDTKL